MVLALFALRIFVFSLSTTSENIFILKYIYLILSAKNFEDFEQHEQIYLLSMKLISKRKFQFFCLRLEFVLIFSTVSNIAKNSNLYYCNFALLQMKMWNAYYPFTDFIYINVMGCYMYMYILYIYLRSLEILIVNFL